MCDRQARVKKIALPRQFWQKNVSAEWNRQFLLQCRHAIALLKLYSADAIIKALRSPAGKKVFSLGAPWLDPIIAEHQAIVTKQQAEQEARIAAMPDAPALPAHGDGECPEPPRPVFVRSKTDLSKLLDLEG